MNWKKNYKTAPKNATKTHQNEMLNIWNAGLQAEYDQLQDYITQSNIVRSRATWYGKGEKYNKYFLNLEKSNKEKSCVRF